MLLSHFSVEAIYYTQLVMIYPLRDESRMPQLSFYLIVPPGQLIFNTLLNRGITSPHRTSCHLSLACHKCGSSACRVFTRALNSIASSTFNMPASQSKTCANCGGEADLLFCSSCSTRMGDKGTIAALCSTCAKDEMAVEAVGKLLSSSSSGSSATAWECRPCSIYIKRKNDEELVRAVGGPTPLEVLKSVAATAPWFIILQRASAEEKLTALNRLKRRTDFQATAAELADGLASRDVMPALLLQQMAGSSANPLAQKALETYVTAKCPSVKYKQLLLAEFGGSIDKARRHFTDQASNPDMVVSALAKERLFLCDWIEKRNTPSQKRGSRLALGIPDAPYEATVWLRCLFRSMSLQIKSAAARNEEANMLVRMWYMDHLVVAHNMMYNMMVRSAASAAQMASPPVHAQRLALPAPHVPASQVAPEPSSKRRRGGSSKGSKGAGKSALAPSSLSRKAEYGDIMPSSANDYSKVPGVLKDIIRPHLNPTQANAALHKAMKVDRDALYALFKHSCRNCWTGGRGFVVHTLQVCKQSNPCTLECPACKSGQYHWAEQCPKNK